MKNENKEVMAYITKANDFARPILIYIRELIHDTCPGVEESIKWGTPHFSYKGDTLCMLAGFKQHCSFSLYKAELMKAAAIADSVKAGKKFGYLDKIKSMEELPSKKVLVSYLKEAMAINESGSKKLIVRQATPKAIEMPGYFADALAKNPAVKKIYDSKSDSFRKEYIVWLADAKTPATQEKRLEQAMQWIAEGKGRFWQYAK